VQPSAVLTITNLTLTTANNWYQFDFPAGTTVVSIQARQDVNLLFTNLADHSSYITIKNGGAYYDEDLVFSGSIWLSAGTDGIIAEIITWSLKF